METRNGRPWALPVDLRMAGLIAARCGLNGRLVRMALLLGEEANEADGTFVGIPEDNAMLLFGEPEMLADVDQAVGDFLGVADVTIREIFDTELELLEDQLTGTPDD
jgi:hypothetical protein